MSQFGMGDEITSPCSSIDQIRPPAHARWNGIFGGSTTAATSFGLMNRPIHASGGIDNRDFMSERRVMLKVNNAVLVRELARPSKEFHDNNGLNTAAHITRPKIALSSSEHVEQQCGIHKCKCSHKWRILRYLVKSFHGLSA